MQMFMYELLGQKPIFAFGCIGIKALKSSSRKREEEGLKKEIVKARWRKKPSEKKKRLILPSSTVSLALVLISPALLVAVHS